MPYVLLDLAKLKKVKKIPYQYAKVGLMVNLKQAKKLITPDEPHSVYVLPEKKAGNSIIQAVSDILNTRPQSRIAIVSPRKNLKSAMQEIAAQYPQAQPVLFKKSGKKLISWLKSECVQPEKTTEYNVGAESADNIQERDAQANIACSRHTPTLSAVSEPNPNTFLSVMERDESHNNDAGLNAALAILKKNRPKKKNDLVRLLGDTQSTSTEPIHELITQLQNEGYIQIDAAENVRYQ